MAFIAETRWLAPQRQSILSWVGKRRAAGGWAQQLRGMREANAQTGCGSNLRERARVMLVVRTRLRFMRTGIADLGWLPEMTLLREHLRSMRL